jgi:5-methylcytosine-specific restriction endonuclease McrA
MVSVPPGRICVACGEWKPAGDYYSHQNTKDGLNPRCKACVSAYRKALRRRNPESAHQKTREYNRRYRAKNPGLAVRRVQEYRAANYEAVMAREARYRAENRDRLRARRRELYRADPARHKAYLYAWKDRKAANGGSFTSEEWIALCERYGYRCLSCGDLCPLTADHVVPVSKGGANTIDNIQPLCQPCNSSKGTRIIDYRSGVVT